MNVEQKPAIVLRINQITGRMIRQCKHIGTHLDLCEPELDRDFLEDVKRTHCCIRIIDCHQQEILRS